MAQSLLDLVKEAFLCHKNKTAVIQRLECETSSITYQELKKSSEAIAQTLAQIPKGNNKLIGVCLEQSLAYPAVIIGILEFGAAFACVDPNWSQDEQNSFLHNIGASWFITNSQDHQPEVDSKQNCEEQGDCTTQSGTELPYISEQYPKYDSVMCKMQVFGQELHVCAYSSHSMHSVPAGIAYVVQTSGSTGKPKVVRVPHAAVVPNILDIRKICNIISDDVVFLSSPSTFDPSVVELFVAFSSGASLLVTSHAVKVSPSILLKVLFPSTNQGGVTVLQTTPSVFCRWTNEELQSVVLAERSSLRSLILGGEPCPPKSVISRWKGRGNQTSIFNIYGITEVSVWASINALDVTGKVGVLDAVGLGEPLSATALEVRDVDTGMLVENGVGEMYIGSASRICVIDEEKNSDLTPPVYRATGDIVKREGMFFFYIGRRDHVVKRWGQRVNLERIELLTATHRDVKSACCVFNETNNLLHLFVVPAEHKHERYEDILRQFLVEHASGTGEVPDEIHCLDHLPITSNGKVDRTALYSILPSFSTASSHTFAEPAFDVEDKLHEVWCSILGVQHPSKSFLSHGGNSILALQMANKIKEIIGIVPDDFISVLLSGANFKDCLHFLSPYLVGKKLCDSRTVENFKFSFVIKNKTRHEQSTKRKSKQNIGCVLGGKSFESVNEVEGPVVKKLKDFDDIHDILVSSSSRGCFMKFSSGSRVRQIPVCEVKHPSKVKLLEKWSIDLQKCIDASPLCLNFKSGSTYVAVGSHSGLLAVCDGDTGERISSCTLPGRIESSACHSCCGKYLYVGCHDGCVYCIAVNSGKVRWKFQTGGVVKGCLAVSEDGDKLLVGSYDQELYCVDSESGELVWQFSISSPEVRGSWTGSPVFVQSLVISGQLAGMVIALRADDGQLVWRHKLKSPIFASLALIPYESPLVLCAEMNCIIHCYEAMTGVEAWQWEVAGKIFSSPSIFHEEGENSVFILLGSNDGHVYCLRADSNHTVNLQWETALGNPIVTTPFPFVCSFQCEYEQDKSSRTLDGRSCDEDNVTSELDCRASTGSLPFCIAMCNNGVLHVLHLKNGSVKAQWVLPAEVFSSPAIHGNHLFVGCRDNQLYCLELL